MRFRLSVFLAITALSVSAISATTFSKKNYPHGNFPQAVVSADINRDGFPDVIGAYRTPDTGVDHGYLDTLMGNSAGLASGATFATTSDPVAIAAGDFNNDGYPDVMVLEDTGYQLFLSAQNGTLLPQKQVPFGCDCVGNNLVAVDLNRDHIADIAFTICSSTGCALHTGVNDGTGLHFSAGGQSTGIGRVIPNSLVATDFNRDGIDDLAVVEEHKVEIFRSTGGGQFTLLQTLAPRSTPLFALAAGDIDATNGPDLVFAASPSCFPDCLSSPTIFVYLNNGSGTLSSHANYTPAGQGALNALRLVDITGDNRLDLLAINSELQLNHGFISWAHYTGSGTFGTFSTLLQLGKPRDVFARDLNRDSRHDLVVADQGFGDYNISPGTYVFLNTTSNAAICTPPSSANLAAKLCSPTSTTSSRTFTVKAAGNSPTGVRRVELWVDGKKKYNSPDDRLKTTVTLTSGTHTFEIVAVDQFGKVAKTSKSISVP